MSTFKGVMEGFEDIRVDYFRAAPGLQPPRACFLSHVHSDHLAGLDSKHWKTSFIYCSPATREILLRLEKRVDRVGFERKTLEVRKVQYKHLEKLLKPIPLGTPTQIELRPGVKVQVTLFDANHCAGAVMFLFEMGSRAVLYTGDIRSEPWHVASLARHPLLMEYTSGIKTLDCIYLDTSRTDPSIFPPKAEGLKELLQKVVKYPADTVFHFTAWTYGYEEVWMALSKALQSQIHVNRYTYRIFESLGGGQENKKKSARDLMVQEGPTFAGFICGNTFQDGCLTTNPHVRLHSCEKRIKCPMLNSQTVWITPIVRWKDDGAEVPEPEPAIIQSGNDLSGRLQFEFEDDITIDQLMALFADVDEAAQREVRRLLVAALESPGRAFTLSDLELGDEQVDISLDQFAQAVLRSVTGTPQHADPRGTTPQDPRLPRTINFPYSRHSSYQELCALLELFKPKDVWPCTENPLAWHEDGLSIRGLFGDHCSATHFRYDAEMKKAVAAAASRNRFLSPPTQTTDSSPRSSRLPSSSPARRGHSECEVAIPRFPAHAAVENHRMHASATASPGSSNHPVDIDRSPPGRTTSTLRLPPPPPMQPSAWSEHGHDVRLGGTTLPHDVSAGPRHPRRKEAPVELEARDGKRLRLRAPAPTGSRMEDGRRRLDRSPVLLTDVPSVDGSDPPPVDEHMGALGDPHDTASGDSSDGDHAAPRGSDVGREDSDAVDVTTFTDPVDGILRCTSCGYEIRGGRRACCAPCGPGDATLPHLADPGEGALPQIALAASPEDVVMARGDVRGIVGGCPDHDCAASDAPDSVGDDFAEAHADHGMIDDAAAAALEVSPGRGLSPASDLSDGRIARRAAAFAAARRGAWHEVSAGLVSLPGNHQEAEVEL